MDVKAIKERMAKPPQALTDELLKIRTGRAHSGLLDHVKISCYGQEMALPQTATVTVGGTRLLIVAPWDQGNIAAIEKGIRDADLGLNPSNDGARVLVQLPELSEDRRIELVKLVKREAESARVAVRNIRRNELSSLKDSLKAKEISENEKGRFEKELQKLTDEAVAKIDAVAATKAEELMKV